LVDIEWTFWVLRVLLLQGVASSND
jgi:hypothetical protein